MNLLFNETEVGKLALMFPSTVITYGSRIHKFDRDLRLVDVRNTQHGTLACMPTNQTRL